MATYRSFYSELTEDYPMGWNKEDFEAITSFTGKLKYATTHLPKIASGSGRVVFKVDDTKVIKIAKNQKGLAQNAVESEKFLQKYDVVARTFDNDEHYFKDIGPFWVEMELAHKTTKPRFKKLTGVSMDDLDRYLRWRRSLHKQTLSMGISAAVLDTMRNNEFVEKLERLISDYDMGVGDMGRVSTYGEVLRNGHPTIVLVDFGLTEQVYNDFYRVNV